MNDDAENDADLPPFGRRLPEHEHRYSEPSDNPRITRDEITAAVEGYFRVPPLWIGSKPSHAASNKLNPEIHHETVFRSQLACGIDVRVQRDGLFVFDFSNWSLAPQIVFPGYSILEDGGDYQHRPTEANQKAERQATLRCTAGASHECSSSLPNDCGAYCETS